MAKFDYGLERIKFIQNLDYLKTLSVEEYLFRKKYLEMTKKDING